MVFDLRGALLKKQEADSARLADFDFRHRARTMRLLAADIGVDPDALVATIAHQPDEAILHGLSDKLGLPPRDLDDRHASCAAKAREQLVRERGDPTPYRLA